jgi:Contractile injection system tube protein
VSGLPNQPRLLKGAFVDSNLLSFPPLIVPFQFNPEQLTRRRSARIQMPASRAGREESTPERLGMGEAQTTQTNPETISMDIRLDASDALEAGDPVAGEFGVLPALSALELMITPRSETFFGGLLGLSTDFGFGDRKSIPVLVFVWGRQRIYPVRLTELNIQEVEYNPNLTPTRVVVGVSVQVIAGGNPFNRFTEAQRELLAALSLRNAPDITRSIVNL